MLAYLKGKAICKLEKTLVLDVNNTGYLLHITRGLLEKTNEGQDLELFIHTHVREDDISLYGFLTREEWQFFELLLSVSGIGPKSALEILNAPAKRVRQAIAQKDTAFLTQIPGIGKKTAERIFVDLQGKIKEEIMEESETPSLHHEREDIISALVSLGYNRQHVLNGLKKIPNAISGEEAIIKYFLQNI